MGTVSFLQHLSGTVSILQRYHSTARELIDLHKETYSTFWQWNEEFVQKAQHLGYAESRLGWRMKVDEHTNQKSLRNFPMQANGAEVLRYACCKAVKAGIRICCPDHDALLIEAPLNDLKFKTELMQQIMKQSSEKLLDGFALRSEVQVYQYPEQFSCQKGKNMWSQINQILEQIYSEQTKDGNRTASVTVPYRQQYTTVPFQGHLSYLIYIFFLSNRRNS